jgi:hypothetical protein
MTDTSKTTSPPAAASSSTVSHHEPTKAEVKAADAAEAKAEATAKAEAKADAKAALKASTEPKVTSVSPNKAGVGQIISISGENFGEPDEDAYDAAYSNDEQKAAMISAGAAAVRRRSNSTVHVGGVLATHVSFWSPTLIKVHVPAGPVGEGAVVVKTPEGESSRPFELSNA